MSIAIALEVDDKGSVVVRKFSTDTVNSVKKMTNKSIGYVQRLSAKFTKGLGGAVKMVGKGLMNLKTLAMGALAGWGITKVLQEFATFESALADMGKVTDESFDSIQKKIMELPPSLGSATELVQGYYQVISAGVKGVANQMDTLVTASKLAKTAHADQGVVIIGLSSVMDAFKTSSIEAADAMQTMEKTGKTTVGGLIPIIGEISSTSAALGINLNEMGAAFAAVTLASGGTEKAATQYKALMVSLISPTKDMAGLLKEYGGAQEAIKQIGFGGVMRMIAQATGGNATQTKKLLGSVEAYLGFLSVSANQMKTYNQNLAEQKNKTGAVDKAWKDYGKTLNAIWETVKNTIGKQVILIGEKLAPAVKKVIEVTGQWLAKNREVITLKFEGWISGALTGIAGFVEGIAGAVGSLYSLKAVVHESVSFLAAMGAALTDVAAALALLDPIEAAKASIYGFRDTFPALAEMRDRFDRLGQSQADSAREAENSQAKFAGYADKIKGVADEIRKLASNPATVEVNDRATPALKTIQSGMAKIKDKTVYVKVVHTGTGSTERPLTDKIKEITGLYETIPTKSALNVDFTQVSAGIQAIDDRLNSTVSNLIKFKAEAIHSLQQLKFGTVGAGTARQVITGQIKEANSMIERAKQISGIERSLFASYEGTGDSVATPVPAGGGVSVGEINITVPDSTAPQTAEDWRFITREYIVPELERIGHA